MNTGEKLITDFAEPAVACYFMGMVKESDELYQSLVEQVGENGAMKAVLKVLDSKRYALGGV